MKYCAKCGKEIHDEAAICVHCGCAVSGGKVTEVDAPCTWAAVLGFFIPLAGLIMYLMWKDQTPLKAKSAGKGALIGFVLGLVGSILYGCAVGAMVGGMMDYYY